MTDEPGTPDGGAEGRPVRTPGQPGNAKARAGGQQGAASAPKKISAPEPPDIVTGRGHYVSRESDENESEPPALPPRRVSRAPAPPPRIDYGCTPREPKQEEPAADEDLKDAIWRCEELIRPARTLRRFRGSLWDAEKERWPFYRKQIDEGLVRCGLPDDPAYQRKINKLDHEWRVACELRIAAAAALETSGGAAQAAFMQRAAGADPQNVPDVGGKYQVDWDLWHGRNRAYDELSAAAAADYAAVLKQRDEEGRRRVILDRRVKQTERVTQRLAEPASLKDRAHICVWDIIEDRTGANPEMRPAWLDALVVAVNAGLFNEGRRQQSQLFSFSDAGHVIRWDKKSLAAFQQATDAAAHKLELDRDKYRLQRLESLAKGAWMPRRFIARWLTEYCKLSRLPWWLEDEASDDLRGELERVHAAYVDVNGKDEWDGFREPCWTHVQTIIWRVTRDPAAVDKASTDSNRPSLGDTYAKCVGAAVIEMWRLNIGEVKDAARELRRLCLAGELTAYDSSGAHIDKMSWVSLEIVLDNENLLWITRSGQRVGDVVFRRDDILGVWPARTLRAASGGQDTDELPSGDDGARAPPGDEASAGASTSEQFAASIPVVIRQGATMSDKRLLWPSAVKLISNHLKLDMPESEATLKQLVIMDRIRACRVDGVRGARVIRVLSFNALEACIRIGDLTTCEDKDLIQVCEYDLLDWLGQQNPAKPATTASEPPQDGGGAIDTEPDPELKRAPKDKIREAIRAEYKEANDKEQKPPNIKELQSLVQNRLKAMGFRASQANIGEIGGEAEFDKLRIKQGQKWTGRKPG